MVKMPGRKMFVRVAMFGSIAASFVLTALVVAAFTVGIPDVVAGVQRPWVASVLQSHPSRSTLEATLERIHADWHEGKPFVKGQAYSSFRYQKHCDWACERSLQIAFTDRTWFCVITADVVSVDFDREHRVASWTTVSAIDGC